MIKQLRANFKEGMTDAFRKFQESNQPPSSPAPPSPVIPPQSPHPPPVAPQSSHARATLLSLIDIHGHHYTDRGLSSCRQGFNFRPDKRSISQPRSHVDDVQNPLISDTYTGKPHAHRDLPLFDYAHGPGHLQWPFWNHHNAPTRTTTKTGHLNRSPAPIKVTISLGNVFHAIAQQTPGSTLQWKIWPI